MNTVKYLMAWFYMIKKPDMESLLMDIEGGIASFVSIGFSAEKWLPVTDKDGNVLYHEYSGKGEALEGSIVWLGAQQGAAITKAARQGVHIEDEEDKSKKQEDNMENVKKMLHLKADAAEDDVIKVLKEKQARLDALEAIDEALADNNSAGKIAELKAHAADGKAYRKNLVDDAVRFGALIGEVPTDAEAQKKEVEFIAAWPLERIKAMRDKYEAIARVKFPAQFIIQSKDEEDRKKLAAEAEKHKIQTGRKDFTDPKNNELFATVGR